MLTQRGTVFRTFSAEKIGKLTIEVKGSGQYPDKIDFKTFDKGLISRLGSLKAGEVVQVQFALQNEKVRLPDGTELTEVGKNGTAYPVRVPMLKMTALTSGAASNAGIVKDPTAPPF